MTAGTIATCSTTPTAPEGPTAVGEQIRRTLSAKADALVRRSAVDLGMLIDDAFIYVNAAGRRFDKAGYIETYCSSGDVRFVSQEIEALEVRMFGEAAVAVLRLDDVVVLAGEQTTATYQSLCVFTRIAGGWRWAAGQTMAARTPPPRSRP